MNPKPAKLSCHTGALAGTEIRIKRDILIGRQPSCDLVLYPHTVSGQHARLYFNSNDGHYYVEDLGSSNGTWVDRVKVDRPIRLDGLNVISIANDIDFIFRCTDQASSSTSKVEVDPSVFEAPAKRQTRQKTEYQDSFSPPPSIPKQGKAKERQQTEYMESFTPPPSFDSPPKQKESPADQNTVYQKGFSPPPDLTQKDQGAEEKTVYSTSFGTPPSEPPPQKKAKAILLSVNSKGKKMQFTLRPGKNTIGRSSSADITIPDPFISSSHAVIDVKKDGTIILEDLKSSNKTYVKGQSIIKPVVLTEGMQIRFGPNSEAMITSS